MKKLITIFLAIILLCTMSNAEIATESETDLDDILAYELQRYTENIDKITSAEDLRVAYMLLFGKYGHNSSRLGISECEQTIQKMIDLLNEMIVIAVPYEEPTNDIFYSLRFWGGGFYAYAWGGNRGFVDWAEQTERERSVGTSEWGGFADGVIYIDGENSQKVMLVVENFLDIKERFDELLNEIRMPTAEAMSAALTERQQEHDRMINEILSAEKIEKVKITSFLSTEEYLS